jgi:hypothetical protein
MNKLGGGGTVIVAVLVALATVVIAFRILYPLLGVY